MKTKQDVKREVTRILNDDSIRKPRILQFFKEFFEYDLCAKVCKDDKALLKSGGEPLSYYPAMNKMILNTDRLVEFIVQEDKQVLKELLTTNKVIYSGMDGAYFGKEEDYKKNLPRKTKDYDVHQTKYAKTLLKTGKPIYIRKSKVGGEGGKKGGDMSKTTLTTAPKNLRMGILTQPSWLISHSDAMDNHAILRGKWIRERLLGDAIPDVPITVDAMLPVEPKETLRHRMRVTREDECWRCHQKIDPLGFPFEQFNHIGMFRNKEQGKPVNTSGAIILSGETSLDGPVKDPFEMIKKLANSERVEQVFVRHVFRFWMGRNENINDGPILRAAHKAYKESNGSLKVLLTSLLTSDAFLFRKRLN